MQAGIEKADDQAQRNNLIEDKRLAEAAALHFRSVADLARFIMARDAKPANVETMRECAQREIVAAQKLCILTREDARIGYEASNHYYYYPMDLVEKVINCKYVLDTAK
jgi:hypothetical protein